MADAISAASQQMDYMTLLVSQLQNQNPLEPMDNQDMAAQLAQFSELEQSEKMNANLESLNTTFSQVLQNTQLEYARSLLGNRVTFTEEGYLIEGEVKQVSLSEKGVNLDVLVTYTDENDIENTAILNVNLDDIESILE